MQGTTEPPSESILSLVPSSGSKHRLYWIVSALLKFYPENFKLNAGWWSKQNQLWNFPLKPPFSLSLVLLKYMSTLPTEAYSAIFHLVSQDINFLYHSRTLKGKAAILSAEPKLSYRFKNNKGILVPFVHKCQNWSTLDLPCFTEMYH